MRSARNRPAGGRSARRRFGQHFLHEGAIIERIVAAVDPRPGEPIVEIGPGRGALTLPLLRRCGELSAVEIDRDLCEHLRRSALGAGTLHLVNEDVLSFDFAALARPRPLRIVGNLPYNISTPLLFRILGQLRHIEDVHCTLQHEVAQRIDAAPGSRHYGRLSVMVQLDCRVERLFPIAAGAFRPRPRVESAFLRLVPRPEVPLAPEERGAFAELVRHLFSRRRKTLKSALRGHLDEADILGAGCEPAARPQELGVTDFVRLAGRWRVRRQRRPSREAAPVPALPRK